MQRPLSEPTHVWTGDELLRRLGPIPLSRLRGTPLLGDATEEHVIQFDDHEDRLYELIDGLLVEKAMGSYEAILAAQFVERIGAFVRQRRLGVAMGADGMVRLMPGMVRIPDACFLSRERASLKKMREEAITSVVPDLAIEVISRTNTAEEMHEKLNDYFNAGVRSVWYVYPTTRTVDVYSSPTDRRVVQEPAILEDTAVLPGLQIDLTELFDLGGLLA